MYFSWTKSITDFINPGNIEIFSSSLEKKAERVYYYQRQVKKNINKVIEVAKERDEETPLEKELQADAISAFQNIHFLGDILGKMINASLDLGYNFGDDYYLGSIIGKLESLDNEKYGELIKALKKLTDSTEWKQVAFITNREKHNYCFDFDVKGEDYGLLNVSKHFSNTEVDREEVKSFLKANGFDASNKMINKTVKDLSKIKHVKVPDEIEKIMQKFLNEININIGEEIYNILEEENRFK
ncbi:hypothetical protein [Alkalihalophilus marmarensis]|uniref:hypothetical protein n=1 Tax=Alkalihalophilus marmarensis TaxID=521377 RepID=UPI002E1C5895|nr:hypothetical protein [Alkalihalophilus marmarensis]